MGLRKFRQICIDDELNVQMIVVVVGMHVSSLYLFINLMSGMNWIWHECLDWVQKLQVLTKEAVTCHVLTYERKMVELRIQKPQPQSRMEGKHAEGHINYSLNGSTRSRSTQCWKDSQVRAKVMRELTLSMIETCQEVWTRSRKDEIVWEYYMRDGHSAEKSKLKESWGYKITMCCNHQ